MLTSALLLAAIASAHAHDQRDQTPVLDAYHDPNDYLGPLVVVDDAPRVNVSLFVMSRCPDAVSWRGGRYSAALVIQGRWQYASLISVFHKPTVTPGPWRRPIAFH